MNILENFTLVTGPVIASILILISYIPQLIKTYKTKDVEGQSKTFWLLLSITLYLFFQQQLGLYIFKDANNISGILSQFFNLACALIMLFFTYRYSKK